MLIRILRVILLLFWLELGLLLILMPWSDVWDVNYFLYQYPALRVFCEEPLFARNDFRPGSDERAVRARSVSPPDVHRCHPHLKNRLFVT